MEYVVGSVAALVSGNVTPNRPRLLKRALTPTKHQPSPNVTPKSEFVEDRSIFLSPTLQKKKAIVKKSPKRIFQNPDLDTTESNEGNSSMTSPKAEKVKKHLKDQLEADGSFSKNKKSPKHKLVHSQESITEHETSNNDNTQDKNQTTPKKKKKKLKSGSATADNGTTEDVNTSKPEEPISPAGNISKCPKKMKNRRQSVIESDKSINESNIESKSKSPTKQKSVDGHNDNTIQTPSPNDQSAKKKNKKRKKKANAQKNVATESTNNQESTEKVPATTVSPKKKNKKSKKSKLEAKPQPMETDINDEVNDDDETINPNAITHKDSDSEHDSDNEIESENEEVNQKVFNSKQADETSDDDDDDEEEKPKKSVKPERKTDGEPLTEDEIKRTLFVGNVPFSNKCKKEIKKIFSKHGQIETVRIRAVPIKDNRYTPKMAVIKNELHPERTTVNVYVKFVDLESVDKALVENNTILNECHLRVSRSDTTGAEHDPHRSVFVGNLPFAIEDETLRDKFKGCGEIESVRVVRDKKTNVGKGFGYINFASKDGVELALALTEDDLAIKNRIIRVKRCTQTDKRKPGRNQFQKNQKPVQNQFRHKPDSSGPNQFQRQRPGGNGPNQFQRQRPGGPNEFQGQRPGRNGPNEFQGQRPGRNGPNEFQRQRPGGNGPNQFQRQKPGWGNNQMQPRQGNQRGGFGQKQFEHGRFQKGEGEGAFRRIMNKRQHPDGGDGPPNKKQNTSQPKEKKTHKEFVGMTAEKKTKRKFDKGLKKKKALSEILTK